MITYIDKNFNTLSQNTYNDVIFNVQMHRIQCPGCGHSGCMRIHGYYRRKVKVRGGSFSLKVMRLFCLECGQTHAVLPSSIVPYTQASLECQILVVGIYENGGNLKTVSEKYPDVDENNIKSIILRYRKHWKQKLASEAIRLRPILSLVIGCFSHFSRQFLQIHRTRNRLFSITT